MSAGWMQEAFFGPENPGCKKNEQDCQGLGFRKGLKFSFVSRVSRVYI